MPEDIFESRLKRILALMPGLSWIAFGRGFYLLAQVAFVALLARILGAEALGSYALVLAVVSPIRMFADMGLRSLLATENELQTKMPGYLALRYASLVFFVVAALLFSVLYFGESGVFLSIALPLIGVKLAESLSDFAYGAQQYYDRLNRQGMSLFMNGVLGYGGCALTLYLTGSLTLGLYVLLLFATLIALFYDWPDCRIRFLQVEWKGVGRKLWWVMPWGVAALLTSLCSSLPRFLIDMYVDRKTVGIFMALVLIVQVLEQINMTIIQALTGRFGAWYHIDRESFIRRLTLTLFAVMVLVFVLAVLGLLLGDFVVGLVYGPEFVGFSVVLAILLAGKMLDMGKGFAQIGQFVERKSTAQMIISVVTLLTGVVTGFLWVPEYGIHGAAGMSVAMSVVFFALTVMAVWRQFSDQT